MKSGTERYDGATAQSGDQERAGQLSSPDNRLSICVVCCSTAETSLDTLTALIRAFAKDAPVRAFVLTEESDSFFADGVEIIRVPCGTKLSKIRRLNSLISTDLICICDPDLVIREDACRTVLRQALAVVAEGRDVVAFGVVECGDDETMLSAVIAIDKWLSHRLLRRSLWAMGIGVTLPGQFLIVSSGLLNYLAPRVDSYLDDLYLGWLARRLRAQVCRLPVVVGTEEPRRAWGSLLTQRIRWMKGLACLYRHLLHQPSAVGLLTVHYLAYHGIPILFGLAIALLALMNPLVGVGVYFGFALLLAMLSRKSFLTACFFLAVFPLLHLLATSLWWMPASRSVLNRR